MAEKRLKHKWRCVFNYRNEVYILYRYAYTIKQAWYQCCRALANTHNVPVEMVTDRFDFKRGADFEIGLEVEMIEVDD